MKKKITGTCKLDLSEQILETKAGDYNTDNKNPETWVQAEDQKNEAISQ